MEKIKAQGKVQLELDFSAPVTDEAETRTAILIDFTAIRAKRIESNKYLEHQFATPNRSLTDLEILSIADELIAQYK